MEEAGVSLSNCYEKCLGLPAFIERSKNQSFKSIKERVRHNWKNYFLTCVVWGKELLLKAVIQAKPRYAMSVFILPRALCKDIGAMMSGFGEDIRKMTRKNLGSAGKHVQIEA